MTPTILTLNEYEPLEIARNELSETDAQCIHEIGGGKVRVDSPGPQTHFQWNLTSLGWVGYLPIRADFGLRLQPRVMLGNLFRMLEYAYNLQSIEFFDRVMDSSSIHDLYERLALMLARRVLDRTRRGPYRSYLEREEPLTCIRGRLDVGRIRSRPWNPALWCRFEEHSADVEENQILVRALSIIARSGLCTERSLPTIRSAFRTMSGLASHRPLAAAVCAGRRYNRLNLDYQPMHALCRFFLENSGPSIGTDGHEMVPFVVSMPLLFEQFVAAWLKVNLPPSRSLRSQHSMSFGDAGDISIKIDLLVQDARSGAPFCVMDTKYKTSSRAVSSDIEQVVAYAVANDCGEAVLLYPQAIENKLDLIWGSVHVRSLAFDLSGDLDVAGSSILKELFGTAGSAAATPPRR